MSIERVIIKNYRSLRHTDIKFGDNFNIIVGDNESGKSTLLEAINLALRCQINRRPALYELHPFMFNRQVVAEFIASHKNNTPTPPPEILIELYFTDTPELADFRGVNNSLADDQAVGVSLKIVLDEENFREEFAAYVADTDALDDIPIEYYKIDWRSFAWGSSLTVQGIPIKSALIDPSGMSNTYAANKYVIEIVRDYLSVNERVDLALSYRSMRGEFQNHERIEAINAKLSSQTGTVSDKTLSVAMDVTTRSSWERGVLPHLDDIPLNLIGTGEQNAIKIKLAIAAADACDIFLLEEPENHLSHGNLGRLIKHVSDNCIDKQIIVTTHSSFVLNKLGIENVIMFDGQSVTTSKRCPIPLRRVRYRDATTGKRYEFLTNNFSLAAGTIAAIYKSRWQIELFFKWIKQNLKIKSFMGTSKNAVMTQIWIALCVYLLIAYLKFMSKAKKSMQQILNLLQMNLFEKWCIHDLLHGRSTERIHINPDRLSFADKLTGH